MSLGSCWANEVLRCRLRNNLGYVACVFRHFSCDVASREFQIVSMEGFNHSRERCNPTLPTGCFLGKKM